MLAVIVGEDPKDLEIRGRDGLQEEPAMESRGLRFLGSMKRQAHVKVWS